MRTKLYVVIGIIIAASIFHFSCSKPIECDSNKANNKVLALGNIQARLVAKGGESGMNFASSLASETGPIYELIAQGKFNEACGKAESIAKKYGMDLDSEEKGMITMEQLIKDGGKGSGTCSVADAARKQMEVHGLLQAEVDAGRMDSDVFREFNKDTIGFAEMLSTNPTKGCELMDQLKEKYKLK